MSLPEVLRGFDTHPGVLVNWRMYGTNGWEQQPADGLVIENYPMRGPDDYPGNRLAKSIVYPRKSWRWSHHTHSGFAAPRWVRTGCRGD